MASIYKRKGDEKYTISYYLRPGLRKEVRGCADRKATEALARKLENEAMLRRKGVIDAKADQYSAAEAKPLMAKDSDGKVTGGHLADFHAALLAKGVTEKQAYEVRSKVARILDLCGAERISEIVPSAVQTSIGALRDDEDLSLQTCNHYLKGMKQFSRWLRRDGRSQDDAIAHLSGYNVQTDRRHDRRALADDEMRRLIQAAEQGPVVLGMAGVDRAMLYRLATGTGLRANELRSLTPEAFKLSATPPTVTVAAGYSKRRRRDMQPMRTDLAEMLQAYLADRPQGEPVFSIPDKPGKMLRADLKVAGIPYRNTAGQVIDFHALRHTFITNVVKSGASVKVCQELARHSDPKLTMNVYTHLSVYDRAKALDGLPDTGPEKPRKEAARATGTHDAAPWAPDSVTAHSTARKGPQTPQAATTSQHGELDGKGDRSLQSPAVVSTCQRSARPDSTTSARSSMDRASVYGTEGYRFESCRAYFSACLQGGPSGAVCALAP